MYVPKDVGKVIGETYPIRVTYSSKILGYDTGILRDISIELILDDAFEVLLEQYSKYVESISSTFLHL